MSTSKTKITLQFDPSRDKGEPSTSFQIATTLILVTQFLARPPARLLQGHPEKRFFLGVVGPVLVPTSMQSPTGKGRLAIGSLIFCRPNSIWGPMPFVVIKDPKGSEVQDPIPKNPFCPHASQPLFFKSIEFKLAYPWMRILN